MRGDAEILQLLNEQLTSELTAINQYFLHSKMQDNWGFTELAAHTRAESFEEMRHAEALTDRILLLDGLPNYQRLFSVRIGQTVREQFESDLAIELEVVERLRPGIALCREHRDTTSAILLETIMADEEHHIDYLETQLELMNTLGEQLYLAQCVARPPDVRASGRELLHRLSASGGGTMADLPPPVAQPDELSPLDYLFHRGESHPSTRSAFLNLEILDQPADWARLREAMDRASRVVIRMRQKVVIPPLPTTPPRWVVDPDFDLDYHLRRVALPAPGTLRQLLDLAELTLQSPLDTSRALWEAIYVEGLEGGRSALLTKLSHAVTDGLGGIALFEQVYDTERDPAPRPMPPLPVPRDLSGNDLLRGSLRRLPETTFAAGQRLFGRRRAPRRG